MYVVVTYQPVYIKYIVQIYASANSLNLLIVDLTVAAAAVDTA